MRKAICLLVLCLMGIQALAIQVSDTFAGSSTIEYAKTEAVYDSPRQCSQVAIHWMQQLMQEAKRLGLRIQLSFEPRTYTMEQTAQLARKLIDTYPLVDDLELMTEETGGWGAARRTTKGRGNLQPCAAGI